MRCGWERCFLSCCYPTRRPKPALLRPAMLNLPILNVRLQACPEDWQQMTPTAAGRHCAHCDREVVDFTRATAAELAAARAAVPNGRLCGRFRQSQLAAAPAPRLRPRLRRFLVALVLVCGLGLTSREAWAQVRAGIKRNTTSISKSTSANHVDSISRKEYDLPANSPELAEPVAFGWYFDKAPEYPGGMEALFRFVKQNIRYPDTTKAGRVFVGFVITETGQLDNIRIQKGVNLALDDEALRVVRLMPDWIPAESNGHKLSVPFTLPITFSNDPLSTVRKGQKRKNSH